MTDQDAYRRYTTEAESRFTMIENTELTDAQALVQAAIGQGWATLALAAAQERVQPAGRPTGSLKLPGQIRDGEGDLWTIAEDGRYNVGDRIYPTGVAELSDIGHIHGGYTEVV